MTHQQEPSGKTEANDADRGSARSRIRVTVILANHCTFDTEVVTGKQIKETAHIPVGFALFRRVQGGNEPIHDDSAVELRNGDHFFARPL